MKFKSTLPAILALDISGRRRLINIQQLRRAQDPPLLRGPTQRTLSTHPVPGHRLLPLPRSQAPQMKPGLTPITHHGPIPDLRLRTNPARANPTDPRLAGKPRRRALSRFELSEELDDEGVGLSARIRRRMRRRRRRRDIGGRRGRSLVEVDDEGWLLARARIVH